MRCHRSPWRAVAARLWVREDGHRAPRIAQDDRAVSPPLIGRSPGDRAGDPLVPRVDWLLVASTQRIGCTPESVIHLPIPP